MKNNNNNQINNNNNVMKINKLLKISENFFTYYIRFPLMPIGFFFFLFFLIILDLCLMNIFSAILYLIIKDTNLWILSVIISLIIFDVIIALWHICRIKKITRIDFIYSSDFDRIFIGTVKRQERAYKNTFLLEMNNIDKFIIKKIQNKTNIFEVILNDNSIIEICKMKDNIDNDFEVLISFLNEKLSN